MSDLARNESDRRTELDRERYCLQIQQVCRKMRCKRNLVPRAFSSFKMAVGETPGQGCQNGSKKFVTISSRKHDEMSSFRLNNGFQLQKTNRAAIRWKQPPKKPFHHVSRDKILHDSWSISAALARGFSDRHFERGEGPGDEVGVSVAVLCDQIMTNDTRAFRIRCSFPHRANYPL